MSLTLLALGAALLALLLWGWTVQHLLTLHERVQQLERQLTSQRTSLRHVWQRVDQRQAAAAEDPYAYERVYQRLLGQQARGQTRGTHGERRGGREDA